MGSGGSRYGAGRPGWRKKCELCLRLDVRLLKARNLLRPGIWFPWNWNYGGEPSGSVGITMRPEAMEIRYRRTPSDGDPYDVCCVVPLERTSCRYGGLRTWFACPDCHRRCSLVYGLNRRGRFSCRVCMRLGYTSEAESPLDRACRKQQKLEALLTEDGTKPKGMRWRTFEHIYARIEQAEEVKEAAMIPQLARLLARCG